MINFIKSLLLEIPAEYFSAINPEYRNGNRIDYSQNIVYPERNYCMYLMHLILKAKEEEQNDEFLNNLSVNAEIYKKMSLASYGDDDPKVETKRLLGARVGYYPDIIIHKSQNNTENNQLAIEVKTVSNLNQDEFNKDLFKTMLYSDVLGYNYSFFLIVNNSEARIAEYLNVYKASFPYYSENENIKIILKESYCSDVKVL